MMYEFETGETSKLSISDAAFGTGRWSPERSPSVTVKNSTAELIQTPSIKEAYRKKRLKGNIGKLAITLAEEDNPAVRIIKFKE